MKNKKLEKLEEDIYKAIDEADGIQFDGCWHVDENDLKERIRFLFWEYRMQNFLSD